MSAFDVYCEYLALKRHFASDSYDYHRYYGKVNAKPSALEKRRDRYYFEKLSKKREYKDILLANFVNKDSWIGDLIDESAEETYKYWKGRLESISYIYKKEISCLTKDDFIVKDGEHPKILKMFLREEISLETITILDIILSLYKYWDRRIDDKYIWPSVSLKIKKYKPFLENRLDLLNLKKITKTQFIMNT